MMKTKENKKNNRKVRKGKIRDRKIGKEGNKY